MYKRKNANAYSIDIGGSDVSSFLSDFIGLERGRKSSGRIPRVLLVENELLRWYLCGIFDAESSMPIFPKSKSGCYIDFCMKDHGLVLEIKSVLERRFGIIVYGPYRRVAKSGRFEKVVEESEIRIRKRPEILKFLQMIGTVHPDKIKRKEMMIRLIEGP